MSRWFVLLAFTRRWLIQEAVLSSLRTSILLVVLSFAWPAYAGQTAAPVSPAPAVPVLPDVILRDESGTTVRAVRLSAPIRVDGQLDEAVYTDVRPMSDLIQTEPNEGAPATEKTEVWVLYDDEYVYVAGRCWETGSGT